MTAPSFGQFIAQARRAGHLVVQARMGMSEPAEMRAGLRAVRAADALTVGTITLDSYTRLGEHDKARAALAAGAKLNGYPIVVHDAATTRAVLDGVAGDDFVVQVRHGSPRPGDIVAALLAAGLHATEGGPVSYCLPYSRAPLAASVEAWARACEALAAAGPEPHLETFGGCMMGQLCPPSMLVALSVLEGLFFRQHGLRSVSLSYAQQTNPEQDREAVSALHRLAGQRLPDVDTHVVIYAYMGVHPRTPAGATALLVEATRLAVRAGAARLIVKTAAEAFRIPTIADNVNALETAAAAAADEARAAVLDRVGDTGIHAEASALIDAVLDLDPDIGRALTRAFRLGYLDVPYCLHPDNAGRARSSIDSTGLLRWSRLGSLPLGGLVRPAGSADLTAAGLLSALSYMERRFDAPVIDERVSARREVKGSRDMSKIHPAVLGPAAPASNSAPARPQPAGPEDPGRHLASPVTRSAQTIQHRILVAAREFLRAAGFIELLAPIIGPVTDPGARGAKQVDVDYYGHRYKMMTSAILYKQASLLAFDKIFFVAPNVRLEPLETASTSRHLAEFHQIDVEMAHASREDAMSLVEGLVGHVVQDVTRSLPGELERLGRDVDAFAELLGGTFERRRHGDAVADLRGLGHPQSPDAEIDWAGEAILSRKASTPFFITDYPKGSRGFYDRESRDHPGSLRNFDLIAPEGFGELCSGSERENDYPTIIARVRESGENPAKYGWYLQLMRDGLPPSAGFGLGLERFTRYVAGLDSVWQASAYPKLPGVVSP